MMQILTYKSIVPLLSFLAMIPFFGFSQSANPAISAASFSPTSIEVSESSQLTISFGNTSAVDIEINEVEFIVSFPGTDYTTDGITVPTGTGATLFNWTYMGTDSWRGVNISPIVGGFTGTVVFDVTALNVSSNSVTNAVLQPFGTPPAFADDPSDNSITATLVVACTDPEPVVEGDFFVCPGGTSTFTVPAANVDDEVVFALSGGGSIISTTGNSATFQFASNPGSYQLTATQTTPEGCVGVAFANVVVEDDIVLVCNDNLNISLAKSCVLVITPDVILESPDYDDDSYTIIVKDENGNVVSNVIDSEFINQTLEVTVIHDCSGNQCWGDIRIEDKIPPVIICENDTLTCTEYQNYVPSAILAQDNCDNAVLNSSISVQELTCDVKFSKIVTVTFTATDLSGNEAVPCTAMIYVEKDSISDLSLPLSYDGLPGNKTPLSCSGNYPLNDDGYPHPSYSGYPGGLNNCHSIEWTYTDIFIPLCMTYCNTNNASYKVIRTWIIVDWCTGEIVEYQQIIKVEDTIDPSIADIADFTANVNPFDCSAQIVLPDATATDNCSADEAIVLTYETSVGTIIGNTLVIDSPAKTMGQGVEITVTAFDCCGNDSESSYFIQIVDNTPPVVVADAHEVISLLPSGTATMYATSIDDGSYDNCGPIGFSAKRMDNGAGKPSIDLFPPSGNDNSQFNEVVHFFCSDIPQNPIMVQFQVCDDADMDGVTGTVGDNCNIAMIEVTVQDKYAPVVQCPANMTISCLEFNDVDVDNNAQLDALFGAPTAAGTCGVDLTRSVTGTDELDCGAGVIFRNFTATNAAGTDQCTQSITILPYAENLLTCDRISFDGLNDFIYNWCDVNDNTNNGNDNLPAIDIVGCEGITVAEVDVDTEGLCTTAGIQTTIDTFDYTGSSACKTYLVHYEVIDQCVFEENYVNPNTGQIDPYHSGNGYFEFYLEYNVVDNDAPELTCTSESVPSDICEGYTGAFSIEATDACTPDNQLTYEFKFDVNGNGSIDLPFNGSWYQGNAVTGSKLGLTAIPQGTHIILWRVGDGCGNYQTCSQTVTVLNETKAPSPYCYSDLSTAVMPSTGTIDIWAKDFDAGSQDNCLAPVVLSMIPLVDIDGLTDVQAYNQSFNHPNVTVQSNGDYGFAFDCSYIQNGVSGIVEVRIYVTDESGNYDYCTAALRIDDNFDVCADQMGTLIVDGSITTEKGEDVEKVEVDINTDLPEYPVSQTTLDDGQYAFGGLYENLSYEVTPFRNDDHLNGISTLDVILIQKHILGLEQISSPYSLIAADVNSDCEVTGIDLVQLRRLILGKYNNDELPSNNSWRFVDSNYEFNISEQPCNFDEYADLFNITASSTADFVGVKIGDINASVEANFNSAAETRTNEKVPFVLDEQELTSGLTYNIPVTAENFNEISGFQFGMSLDGVTFVEIKSGKLTIEEDFISVLNRDRILMAYTNIAAVTATTDEVLFTVVVKADVTGTLSESIALDNKLNPEIYTGSNLSIASPEITFRDGNGDIKASTYTLFQNEPNPFKEQTTIAFTLPKAQDATITIFNVEGKLVYQFSDAFASGENTVVINRSQLPSQGMLYYSLESGEFTATKKMIITD